MAMMIVALVLMGAPGVVFNNLSASGMISSSTTMACGVNGSPTCTLNATVGCAADPRNCSFYHDTGGNPVTIAFLNPCSPFTLFLQLLSSGNYVSFVSSLFGRCSVVGGNASFSLSNQNTTTVAFNNVVLSNSTIFLTWASCSVNFNEGNLAIYETCATSNAGTVLKGTVGPWLIVPSNGQAGGSVWNGVIGNLTDGHPSTPTTAMFVFEDSNYTVSPSGNFFQGLCNVFGVYNGTPYDSANYITVYGCAQFSGWKFVQTSGSDATNINSVATGSVGNGIIGFVLTMIGAALVMFIGLGLYVSGGGGVLGTGINATLASNAQGSKQAFTFGVAMIIFFPLFSEFGTWFSSGYLPLGLDSSGAPLGFGIMAAIVIAIFFLGTFRLSQGSSPDGGIDTG